MKDKIDFYDIKEKQIESMNIKPFERIVNLLDGHSFVELDKFVKNRCFKLAEKELPRDGVITGYGSINGRKVAVYSQDFSVMGGSLGEAHANKICKIQELAFKSQIPIIGIIESGGARIQEGIDSLNGYSRVIRNNTRLSGLVPQISVVVGSSAGGSSYSVGLTDFIFTLEKKSKMFITGSKVIRALTSENIHDEELGGSRIHTEISGVAQFTSNNEKDCFEKVRELFYYLPSNCFEASKESTNPDKEINNNNLEFLIENNIISDEILSTIPKNPKEPYDIRKTISHIVDENEIFEIHEDYAKNIITGFCKVGGQTVGVIANQSIEMAGAIDSNASVKAAKHIRFCDSFNIPLITFVDNPGFWPGKQQEHQGLIKHGAKLVYSYSEATVPLITVNVRKAFGGGYIAMCSKGLGSDVVIAWPTAEIAVMGPKGSEKIVLDKTNSFNDNPNNNIYQCAENGYIDQIIDPRQTRIAIIRSLELLKQKTTPSKEKKHGNLPL